MKSLQWLEKVAPGASMNAIATRAGIYTATLAKQIKRGTLSPEVIIKIARGYNAPVVDALVQTGHITDAEAGLRERLDLLEALEEATDLQLLEEIVRRVDVDGNLHHPQLDQPIGEVVPFPPHPTAHMTDQELANHINANPHQNAAHNPGYNPENEYDQ